MSAGDAVKKEFIRAGNASEKGAIQQIINVHQFFQNTSLPWQLAKVDIITNPKLETQFKVHSKVLSDRGCSPTEMQEQFGFVTENQLSVIENAAKYGVQTKQSKYNAMGYNYEGIYLSRFSDVCLQNAVSHLQANQSVIRIVLCKYVTGKVTKAIPRNTPSTEYIHPTPGFDCHVPLMNPQKDDPPQVLFDNAQIYLFDIDIYKQPQNYPRQVLPFAVAHFTMGGHYIPEIDEESVPPRDEPVSSVSGPLKSLSLSLDTAALSEAEVHKIIKDSLLNPKYEFIWKPAHYCVMMNPELKSEYEAKRQELQRKGCTAEETQDQWGFYVQHSAARGVMICHYGLHTKEDGYNAMGYNSMGVYLSRHVDVALQHCLLKPGIQVIRLILCKFMTGRATKAIPREPGAFEFIKPTLGFDSHECLFKPEWTDTAQTRMDRSMIYLYEHSPLELPVPRPRHVLPYAVLSFSQHGAPVPGLDRIPTLEAAQIECKMTAPAPGPGHGAGPGPLLPGMGGGAAAGGMGNPSRMPSFGGAHGMNFGAGAGDNQKSSDGSGLERLADNPQLQALIMQINAKKPNNMPFVRTGNPWY